MYFIWFLTLCLIMYPDGYGANVMLRPLRSIRRLAPRGGSIRIAYHISNTWCELQLSCKIKLQKVSYKTVNSFAFTGRYLHDILCNKRYNVMLQSKQNTFNNTFFQCFYLLILFTLGGISCSVGNYLTIQGKPYFTLPLARVKYPINFNFS